MAKRLKNGAHALPLKMLLSAKLRSTGIRLANHAALMIASPCVVLIHTDSTHPE